MLHVPYQTAGGLLLFRAAVRTDAFTGKCSHQRRKDNDSPAVSPTTKKILLGLQFQLAFFGRLGARKFLFGACFASTKEQLHGWLNGPCGNSLVHPGAEEPKSGWGGAGGASYTLSVCGPQTSSMVQKHESNYCYRGADGVC